MKGWFPHRAAGRPRALDDELPTLPHIAAGRACCCPARPVVTVIMPPTPGRPYPVDLLLCSHHFQVSRVALKAAGAAVYDGTGALILGGAGRRPPRWSRPPHSGHRAITMLPGRRGESA